MAHFEIMLSLLKNKKNSMKKLDVTFVGFRIKIYSNGFARQFFSRQFF